MNSEAVRTLFLLLMILHLSYLPVAFGQFRKQCPHSFDPFLRVGHRRHVLKLLHQVIGQHRVGQLAQELLQDGCNDSRLVVV